MWMLFVSNLDDGLIKLPDLRLPCITCTVITKLIAYPVGLLPYFFIQLRYLLNDRFPTLPCNCMLVQKQRVPTEVIRLLRRIVLFCTPGLIV